MSEKLSYRDYLIWTASNTAASLNEKIVLALNMRDEAEAVKVLEHALDITPALARFTDVNWDRVEPRPHAEARP